MFLQNNWICPHLHLNPERILSFEDTFMLALESHLSLSYDYHNLCFERRFVKIQDFLATITKILQPAALMELQLPNSWYREIEQNNSVFLCLYCISDSLSLSLSLSHNFTYQNIITARASMLPAVAGCSTQLWALQQGDYR